MRASMFLSFIWIGLIMSCSMATQSNKREVVAEEKKPLINETKKVSVQTGKVVFEKFSFRKPDGVYHLQCADKTYRFFVKNQVAQLYLPANYFSKKSSVKCVYLDGQKEIQALDVVIEEYDYPKERLRVAKSKVDYSKKDLERIIKEKEIKRKIYLNSSNMYLFNRPFKVPLNSYITSHYGNQRLFNNKKKSQHLGNDLRAAVGVEIPAANRGKVVFTGNLFFSGNVVVIDHGLDIFSVYGHLSKILVSAGSIVNQGDIVGLAGATGRVSGPHLHWGIKINGSWIDGFSLVDASKLHINDES
ncbi:MAG: M23 family metallopeptidase [Bacteriovoracaceae bacterium]